MKPLAIDLFCGLGGWAEGLLAEGYDVVGFDIERHEYGAHRYPAQLVLQDVRTLRGSQFRDASLIVASPPCQEYSYMAMPWKLAKAKAAAIRADTTGRMLADLNRLFDACFRIQAQASLAAGRHVPMVVENVRGAIPWVGRSRWNFGSFHLWGDVPPISPLTAMKMKSGGDAIKAPGMDWKRPDDPRHRIGQDFTRLAGHKLPGFRFDGGGRSFQSAPVAEHIKCGGDWFNAEQPSILRLTSSKSPARKMASAMIAKIPFALSRHIAAVYRPEHAGTA